MTVLFRIQNTEGRGPWINGFANVWASDRADTEDLPAFYRELGIDPHEVPRLIPEGMHAGCACRTRAQLNKWFSRPERRRLQKHGFGLVVFAPDVIIAETLTQVFFANRKPLASLHLFEAAA